MKIKSGRKTITAEIAYLSGFFDGEGCIRIKKPTTGSQYYIIAHVTNSNKEILQRYMDLFGGNIRRQERTPNKTIFNYYITCSEAVDMLKILNVYLIEKNKQADYAIWFHKEKGNLTPCQRLECHNRMMEMKKINIYENQYLLEK